MAATFSLADEAIVYTFVDQVFSEPILKAFEEKTGIKVKALYDVEAAKTVGLVNRLITERKRLRTDVDDNTTVDILNVIMILMMSL